MGEAFGFDIGVAELVAAPLECGLSAGTAIWLLEEAGGAVSTVTTCRSEDVVLLWCMATPPTFARRGYARALLGAVLDWAHQDGATLGLLGATAAGYPLYEATGWRTAEEWMIYTDAESEQFTS